MDIFTHMQQSQEIISRMVDVLGMPHGDPFNEEATISAVDDPEEIGRVRVIFSKDHVESDWLYVNGSGSGKISAQYIGARCLITKIRGNSAAGVVSAIYSGSSDQASVSNPVQIPMVVEQLASKGSDPGLKCNEGNKGRAYLVSNEFGQDLVICLRRNSIQRDGGDKGSWSWKSLTHSEWIEKGLDPGAASDTSVTNAYTKNPGIPKCTKDMAGEIHEFSEDRAFRSYFIHCKRDENGNYNWAPISATPTFVRTTLPNCTESLHGMNALIDTGRESEHIVCSRYSGKMLWTKQGKREPLQFFNDDVPPSKDKWVSGIQPIAILNPSLKESSIAKGFEDIVLREAFSAINPFGTDPYFKELLGAANALPGTFDSATTWSNVAKVLIANKSTMPVDSLVSQLSDAFARGGDISAGTSEVLASLGGIADTLVSGIKTNNTSEAFQTIGKQALTEAIRGVSPGLASVYFGYTIGGALGAIDSAVAVGLDVLPPTLGGILSPLAAIGQRALAKQPIGYSTILDAAIGGGLAGSVLSLIEGQGDLTSFNFDSLLNTTGEGGLGVVSQLLGSFSQLDTIPKIGLSLLPLAASTVLGLYGQGEGFASFLGNGGLPTDIATSFLGTNPVTGLIGGVSGLVQGGGTCPCSSAPSCRKTSHGEDSDGNNLLKTDDSSLCGNNFSGRPFYPNDPTNPAGTSNPISSALGIADSYLGADLTGAVGDLTGLIKSNPKLDNIGQTMWDARHADGPEHNLELAYTGEVLSKALKTVDNNITTSESVNRKLIDSTHQMLSTLLEPGADVKGVGAVSELLRIVKSNSQAIQDLHNMAQSLNAAKNGSNVSTGATPAIAASAKAVTKLVTLSSVTKAKATEILANGIRRADAEWRSASPGLVDLANIVLGEFSPDLPTPFEKQDLVFNKDRIFKESLASQVNNTSPQLDIKSRISREKFNEIGPQTLSDIIRDIQENNKGKGRC